MRILSEVPCLFSAKEDFGSWHDPGKETEHPGHLGDDIGMWNISAYHGGMIGGSMPNIDRIAKEGMIFMNHYGQVSCTAGRAAFSTGQYCAWVFGPAKQLTTEFFRTFKDYPPRQASFGIDFDEMLRLSMTAVHR